MPEFVTESKDCEPFEVLALSEKPNHAIEYNCIRNRITLNPSPNREYYSGYKNVRKHLEDFIERCDFVFVLWDGQNDDIAHAVGHAFTCNILCRIVHVDGSIAPKFYLIQNLMKNRQL